MKLIVLPLILLVSTLTIGQENGFNYIRKGDLPEGVYMTLEDVLNRKPPSTDEVYFKTNEIYDSDNLPERAYFILNITIRKLNFL